MLNVVITASTADAYDVDHRGPLPHRPYPTAVQDARPCAPIQLSDVPRVREALRTLVDDGLATRLGDRVGVSRAAVRFNALGPL